MNTEEKQKKIKALERRLKLLTVEAAIQAAPNPLGTFIQKNVKRK